MLTLPAALTHDGALDTVRVLNAQAALQPDGIVIDASALTRFDSSALAVLLACRRQATAVGKTFAVQGLPASVSQLAALYGVAELIPASA